MYRFEQQFRSIYYTVNQATVLNATDILWKDSKSNMRNKRNNSFFLADFLGFSFFAVFFKMNRTLFMSKVVLTKKKKYLNEVFSPMVQTHRNSLV